MRAKSYPHATLRADECHWRASARAWAPGPGWLWALAALTSRWQCGHVSTGSMTLPQVSWTNSTGGPAGVGAHWSPQWISVAMTGNSARPFSVRWYSYRGGCWE